jgi:hypothetical protein
MALSCFGWPRRRTDKMSEMRGMFIGFVADSRNAEYELELQIGRRVRFGKKSPAPFSAAEDFFCPLNPPELNANGLPETHKGNGMNEGALRST